MLAGNEKIGYHSKREFSPLKIHNTSACLAEYQQDSGKLSSRRALIRQNYIDTSLQKETNIYSWRPVLESTSCMSK